MRVYPLVCYEALRKLPHMLSDHPGGPIDYFESGSGPPIVLVPGSCSTGVAWRPVIATWNIQFRSITTSLPGYGGTAERRTIHDASISYLADTIEAVIRRVGISRA